MCLCVCVCRELYSRDYLDAYLSRVLDVPLDEHGRLAAIDDSSYVLTLDFAIKMLNIHERAECGVPVILEGETGVGKTALIEMLSKLWNFSVVKTWTLLKERVMDFVKLKLKGVCMLSFNTKSCALYTTCTCMYIRIHMYRYLHVHVCGSNLSTYSNYSM